jgi:hypothetical protein
MVIGSPWSDEPSIMPPRSPVGLTASSMAGDIRNSCVSPLPACVSSSLDDPLTLVLPTAVFRRARPPAARAAA